MKCVRLSDTVGMKSENLQLMKFLASIMVIISHSFILSTGQMTNEWFAVITNEQLSMGSFAVAVFFLCSGYLISMSLEKSKTAYKFFEARIIRLLPTLIFVCLMVILLCGFITDLPKSEYYSSPDTWSYMLNAIFIKKTDLPGVFTHNIYIPTVNGPLWTLRLEALCYVLCFLAYKVGFFQKKRFVLSIPIVFAMAAFLWNQIDVRPNIREILRPALLFYIGIGFWVYREHILLSVKGLLIAMIGLVLLFSHGNGYLAMLTCFPYILMVLWFGIKQCSPKLGILGNYSYVIYLWAFPIQQAIVHYHGGYMDSYKNCLISIPITILVSIPTYHFVEKGFLTWYKALKKKVGNS